MGVNEESHDEALQTERVIQDYKSNTLGKTLIFSNLREDKAFDAILDWLCDNDITPEIHPKKWELVYTKTKEPENGEDKAVDDGEDEVYLQPQSF